MSQPTDSLTFADLAGVARGGLVKEEVLQQIQDLSLNIETAVQDRLATATVKSHGFEWLEDELADPTDSAVAEGTDYTTVTAAAGLRKRNFTQYNVKGVNISDRSMMV